MTEATGRFAVFCAPRCSRLPNPGASRRVPLQAADVQPFPRRGRRAGRAFLCVASARGGSSLPRFIGLPLAGAPLLARPCGEVQP